MPAQIKVEIAALQIRKWQNFLPVFVLTGLLLAIFRFADGTWIIFVTFLKIGTFAIGGGFTAIPLI
jgi:hypothetical protein